MEKNGFLLLVFVLHVLKISADDVLVFNDSDFENRIKDHSIVLVKFFSPWCSACKTLAPEFEKAASVLRFNSPPVVLAEVDCTLDGKSTCSAFGVKGYPTLKVFSNGQLLFPYDGPRDAGGIIRYVKMKIHPGSRELETVEELHGCLDDTDNYVIGFIETRGSELEKSYQKLAESLKLEYRFAHTYSNRVMSRYGYRNDIVLFRALKLETKMEPSQVKFEGKPALYELRTWLTNNYHGLVGYRTQSNKEQFLPPHVIIYCDVEFSGKQTDTRYWRNRVINVAKKYVKGKHRVTFSISDAREFRQELLDFNLDPLVPKPLVAARDASQRRFAMRKEFSVEELEQFVEELLSGSLNPIFKSDPVPATSNGRVKIVVRSNFHEIVNDPSKDVFLELYAPWCQLCKSVAAKLEEVAEKLANDSDIVIARIDVTTNELPRPFYVKGYPSLYFVQKFSKTNPKLYEGVLETRDFIRFIAAEATIPLKQYNRKGQRVEENAKETEEKENGVIKDQRVEENTKETEETENNESKDQWVEENVKETEEKENNVSKWDRASDKTEL